MIALVVVYTVKPGTEAQAEEHLRALVAGSRAEPGCRTYDVNRSADEPRRFLIYERYDDEAALDAHRATPHFLAHGRNGLQAIAESRDATRYHVFE